MNQTTTLFVKELKKKELNQYTLGELQEALQQCKNLYSRFKGLDERHTLNAIWNKMGHQYNHLLQQRFNHASSLYLPNYLLNLKEDARINDKLPDRDRQVDGKDLFTRGSSKQQRKSQ